MNIWLICSDRAPAWDCILRILVGDSEYILYTKQFVDSGLRLVGLSRALPRVITDFTGGGHQW